MNNTITLNDGIQIPAVGFGTFLIPPDGSTYTAVLEALQQFHYRQMKKSMI